jgi:hypothetical protein
LLSGLDLLLERRVRRFGRGQVAASVGRKLLIGSTFGVAPVECLLGDSKLFLSGRSQIVEPVRDLDARSRP